MTTRHLAVLALALSSVANAMPIAQYDRMSVDDRTNYESLLVVGTKNGLLAHNQPEKATRLINLFLDGTDSGGGHQFLVNLQKVRVLNERNSADPNNKQPVYQVEHAFYLMLKDNDITVPVDFLLTINKDFKPSHPSN